MQKLVVVSFFLFIFTGVCTATTYTVDNDGPADYSSIQEAVNNASSGDTIIVKSGIYAENINVNVDNIKIISESGNPDDTMVQAFSSFDDVFYVYANNVSIEGFRVTGATNSNQAGFHLNNTMNCFILNNTIVGNDYAIYIYNSSKNTLNYNNVLNNINGIDIESNSNNNTLILNDIFYNNNFGINLFYSHNNTLIKNNVSSNYDNGIYAYYSSNNVLTSNMLSNNDEHGIHMEYLCNYNTLTNNKALSNNRNGICMGTSSYNSLTDNTALNNYIGFSIYGYNYNNTLIDNIASNNVRGIYFTLSSNGTLINNSISNNGMGISLDDGISNTLLNNKVINNNGNGIFVFVSSNITLTNNTLSGNSYDGIRFYFSNNNTLSNSTISNNNIGIGLDSSHNNKIYNNYINNQDNVYFHSTSIGNVWNVPKTASTNIIGGLYLGGNYWSTPSDTGFSQVNEDVNGDGICDAIYTINEVNVDYLPLSLNEPNDTPSNYGYYGYLIWDGTTNQSLDYTWNALSYSGFFYDLESGLGSETMTIHLDSDSDRNIGEGDLEYETTPISTDFEYGAWGSYEIIGFMAEKYFVGYTSSTHSDISNDAISLLSSGHLTKVLIDSDENMSIYTGARLVLEEGYSLDVVEVNLDGDAVLVQLNIDGENVGDFDVISSGSTYIYETDIGDVEDVPIIAVNFAEIFNGTETNGVFIEGIFQISDEYVKINPGDDFGRMEIKTVSTTKIGMENDDSISLSKGDEIEIMGDIKFKVADNDTLRFGFTTDMNKPGTYELRGTITKDTGFKWTPMNFEGLYYDIDAGTTSESFEVIDCTDRIIDENNLVYTARIVDDQYEYNYWGTYNAIGLFGENYVPLRSNTPNKVAKLLVDSDDIYTLRVGLTLNLGEGFAITPKQIDVDGEKVWLELTKDGKFLDDDVYNTLGNTDDSSWDYEADGIGGEDDVVVLRVHVNDVFQGQVDSLVIIEGIWLMSDEAIELPFGDMNGLLEMDVLGTDYFSYHNPEPVILERGNSTTIIGDFNIKVADSSDIRYYPFVEINVSESNAPPNKDIVFNGSIQEGDGYQINNIVIDVPEVFVSAECCVFKVYDAGELEQDKLISTDQTITFTAEGETIEVTLLSVSGGTLPQATVSITITDDDDIYLKQIVDGGHENAEFVGIYTMSLQRGWNLVSIPIVPDAPSASSIFGNNDDVILPAYSWNTANKQYYETESLEIGKGYWVLALNNTQINIEGTPYDL